MSKHTWAQENIAAFVLGGLESAERERLVAHASQCAECTQVIDEIRALERKLTPWFSDADPGPALEDRIIQALPSTADPLRRFRTPGKIRVILFAAASLVLAAVGAGASALMDEHYVTFPAPHPERAAPLYPAESSYVNLIHGTSHHGISVGREMERDLKSAGELAAEVHEKAVHSVNGELGNLGWSVSDGYVKALEGRSEASNLTRSQTFGLGTGMTGESAPKDSPAQVNVPALIEGPGAATTSRGIQTFGRPAFAPPMGGGVGGGGFAGRGPGGVKDLGGKGGEVNGRYSNDTQLPPLKVDFFKPADDFGDGDGKKKGKDSKDVRELEDHFKSETKKISGLVDPAGAGDDKRVAQAGKSGGQPKAEQPPAQAPEPGPRKIIIRSGDMEFEVDSFDTAVATIMRLVTATRGGFVATINSDKLANGKVRGSVMVRVPPEQLDKFVLDLRKELGKSGELKNQRIGSKDISKEYTDLESRLRASRTMEERLLRIIKDGKGQIKDLLLAEKELGEWRSKIELMEGEIRYYNNLVSLSTLTINLSEKELRTAASVTENERVQAGIEVDDVEKAHQEALKAIAEFKGRITRSELKQHAAGQFNALLHFEVTPEATGPMRDRLKQLGTMVRLQIDRLQQTSNGGPAPKEGKIERGNTQFLVSIYNLANVAPRETVMLRLAAADVPAVYQKLREIIAKAKGHVFNAQLNEQDRQNISAQLDFDVRRLGVGEVQAALAAAGETLSRKVDRIPESDNVTDSKVMYRVVLVDADSIPPRETVALTIAAKDVPGAYQKLREAVAKTKALVITAQINEQDRRNINAQLDFVYRRADEAAVRAALAGAGETLSRQVTRLPANANLTDAKVMIKVALGDADALPPRETVVLTIASTDVGAAYETIRAALAKAKGRVAEAHLDVKDQRNVSARFAFDIPRDEQDAFQKVLADAGEALTRQITRKQETISVTDTRVGFEVVLTPAANLKPRETTTLALEVSDVSATLTLFKAKVNEAHGRTVDSEVGQDKNGQVTAIADFVVPLSESGNLVEKFKTAGQVRLDKPSRNPEAPEGKLALARIVVTLSNSPLLLPHDQGLWAQLRSGLAFSLRGLSISASWLIVGLLFVLPWVLVLYVALLLTRRWWRSVRVADGGTITSSENAPSPPPA